MAKFKNSPAFASGMKRVSIPPFPDLDEIVARTAKDLGVSGKRWEEMPELTRRKIEYLTTICSYSGEVYGLTARALTDLQRGVGLFGFEQNRGLRGNGRPPEIYGQPTIEFVKDNVAVLDGLVETAIVDKAVAEYIRALALLNFGLADHYKRMGKDEAAGVIKCFTKLGNMLVPYHTARLKWEKEVGYANPWTVAASAR